MLSGVLERVLPAAQLRSSDELTRDLDLSSGDSAGKKSAFWTMLALSAVVASGGVLTDSTATVIGAMIIAPLSTPIMDIAMGIVRQRGTGAVGTVVLGCLLVVAIGAVFSLVVPGNYELLGNGQIAGRTSPGLMDLVAALATGMAGAVGLARRDVAAVLPGVAIAISLVPPLVVAGVCLGQGAVWPAAGALVLFLSNLLALVFAGMVVFAASGHHIVPEHEDTRSTRKARVVLGVLFTLVLVPLAANTVVTVLISTWTDRAEEAADRWISGRPDASVTRVYMASRTMHIDVRIDGSPPPVDTLRSDLEGRVPDQIVVVVKTTHGERLDVGPVGG
ncbi:putative hydrophobic protein (TIGR00271 family) [Murinocardiopsis flavida]|uniref:Putative hydrophobic protein (TIGR00271 family) n=1 Tax=Murinocardiopsis flavida TaxID=645275 RepID=A0A2P8CPQ6_9ACTN|nr:DUF389 domain-containing protein [Murinocardiopsis flavida]PSK86931.1 putative hydrophobic protein (TIGR00271 family) [Murinocardiopsis flavida]